MPSTLNSTLVTPTLSEARAAMVTRPETTAPVSGRGDRDGRLRGVGRRGHGHAHARDGGVARGVIGRGGDGVRSCRGARGVPGGRVGGGGVAERASVPSTRNSTLRDADVVGGEAREGDEPETAAPFSGRGDRDGRLGGVGRRGHGDAHARDGGVARGVIGRGGDGVRSCRGARGVPGGRVGGGGVAQRASVPSTLNSTRVTPTLSEARAAMFTRPETTEPFAGEVIETDGGVVSDPVVARAARCRPAAAG